MDTILTCKKGFQEIIHLHIISKDDTASGCLKMTDLFLLTEVSCLVIKLLLNRGSGGYLYVPLTSKKLQYTLLVNKYNLIRLFPVYTLRGKKLMEKFLTLEKFGNH